MRKTDDRKLSVWILVHAKYHKKVLVNTNQFSKSKFSKSTQQIFKVKKDSDRARFSLSENIFNLNFCRVVFENFDSIIDQSLSFSFVL